jgi:hypothetical protein
MNALRAYILNILSIALWFFATPSSAQLEKSAQINEQETAGVDQKSEEQPNALPSDSAPKPDTSNAATQATEKKQEGEEEVDLDKLDEEKAPSHPTGKPESGGHPGSAGHPGSDQGNTLLVPLKFKLFFDLLLQYEFESQRFEFTRDHAFVLLELTVTDWLSFRTDIAPEPHFYELVFSFGKTAEIRVGKVLIPFGQNEFHHLIGGRVDKQSIFLPTIWADYGIAFKHNVYDGELIGFDYSAWVVNGFQESANSLSGMLEPSSQAGSLSDDNKMKGVGLRPTLRIGNYVTLGTSWYLDIWNEYEKPLEHEKGSRHGKTDEQFMLVYGADVDFGYGLMPVDVLRDVRLRAEVAWAQVMLPDTNWTRGFFFYYSQLRRGYNIELSYRVMPWFILRYRFGYLDRFGYYDALGHLVLYRIHDVDDLYIHEPAVIMIFGPVQFSLILQVHDRIYDRPADAPPPVDYTTIFARVMFRY